MLKPNEFELNDKQHKLCHELTMEFLRQNDLMKVQKDENGKFTRDYAKAWKSYFSVYEEIAVFVHENWNKTENPFSK